MPSYNTMKRFIRVVDILALVVLFANHLTSTAMARPDRTSSARTWRQEKFNDKPEGYLYDLLIGDRGISHFLHFGLKVKVESQLFTTNIVFIFTHSTILVIRFFKISVQFR